MVLDKFNSVRMFNTDVLQADFVIVGGGISGVCAAITAARQGLKVVLIQDRPVLGGNGSSEIRLWMLGATSHMGNNNRWAREGGVIKLWWKIRSVIRRGIRSFLILSCLTRW